jgi:aminoglycoside N3'-acetyltransferase
MSALLSEQATLYGTAWTTAESDEVGRFLEDYASMKIRSLRVFGLKDIPGRSRITDWLKTEKAHLRKALSGRRAVFSREDSKAENMVITHPETYPFCLHRVPPSKRAGLPADYNTMLNWADGQLDLSRIFARINIERFLSGQSALTVENKRSLIGMAELLAGHGYTSVRYKRTVIKKDILSALRKLGIRRGNAIVVHSSLSSMGRVEGGARAVCEAIMETVGEDGVVIMPSFNHGAPFAAGGEGFFSPLHTPTVNGAVAECFRRMSGVFRSINPTHSFCAWGKNAGKYVEGHHRVLTMGKGSPLELLERQGGKIILIGAGNANTFHHVVEMTNNVPCLGKRTEEYPVKLPSGRMVKCRTWGWRNSGCPITDSGAYWDMLKRKHLSRSVFIEDAETICVKMSDCRNIIELYLRGRVEGYAGCRTCPVRPASTPYTVQSDWNDATQTVWPGSPAFID